MKQSYIFKGDRCAGKEAWVLTVKIDRVCDRGWFAHGLFPNYPKHPVFAPFISLTFHCPTDVPIKLQISRSQKILRNIQNQTRLSSLPVYEQNSTTFLSFG